MSADGRNATVGYEEDIVLWAEEQARLIRARRFDLLDIEHVADEVEDVGRSERQELSSRLAVLLAHLWKWQNQPERRGGSWQRTIHEQRKRTLRNLRDAPSLRPQLTEPEFVDAAWGDAVTRVFAETDLEDMPETCPWSLEDVLGEGWMPPDVTHHGP